MDFTFKKFLYKQDPIIGKTVDINYLSSIPIYEAY